MNIEFHYYVIHWLCTNAGMDEATAKTIAYSSQFVDHNIISYTIRTETGTLRTAPTQNYGFWNESFPREVYIPYHFFPGNGRTAAERRADGRTNPMCCTANSPPVKELLVTALKTRNPYRVGIALHTYADSWAHQNFSGLREDWNTVDPSSIIPPIGHAHVMKKPDVPGLKWTDPRLASSERSIDNRERMLGAARMIYKYLRTYNRLPFDDVDLILWKLDELLGPPGHEKQSDERISDFIIDGNMERYHRSEWLSEAVELIEDPGDERMFKGYDKVLWLKDAVLYRSSLVARKPVRALPGFKDSDFAHWLNAAREHLRAAQTIISQI